MKILITIIILSVCALRLWMSSSLPVQPVLAPHDDLLFISLAENFARWVTGEESLWLGPYHSLTLAKGPFYPIWLGLVRLSGIPVYTADTLLYLFAGIVLIIALRKIVPGKIWLVLLFILYALNPMLHEIDLRMLRSNIYPALTVLTLACFTGLYTRCKGPYRYLFFWASGSGLSVAAFWITREESIWLLPGILLLLAAALVSLWRERKRLNFFGRSLTAVFLPLGIFLFILHLIASLNLRHYGVYTVLDLTSKPFAQAYGAITRVKKPAGENRYILVSKSTRKKIYAQSPAFEELRESLESGKWQVHSPQNYFRDGEPRDIVSGWFQWALRDAADSRGYYVSPGKANAYYRRLSSEINNACEQGRLDCLPLRETLIPRLNRSDAIPFRDSFLTGFKTIFQLKHFKFLSYEQVGFKDSKRLTPEQLYAAKLFSRVTHSRLAPFPESSRNSVSNLSEELKIFEDPSAVKKKLNVRVLETIARFYSRFLPPLFAAALAGYILLTIAALIQKKNLIPIVFAAALLGVSISRLVILTLIDITSFDAFGPTYLAVFYPLLYIFLAVIAAESSRLTYEHFVQRRRQVS